MLHKTPVKMSILILSCILFAGVLSMAFGFYHRNALVLSMGVSLTFITSLMITVQNVLTENKIKVRKRGFYKG